MEHGETPKEWWDRLVAEMDRIEIVRHGPDPTEWGQALLRVEAQLAGVRIAYYQVIVGEEMMDDATRSGAARTDLASAEQQLRDQIRDEVQTTLDLR